MGIKCRLIKPIGVRYELHFDWRTGSDFHISRQDLTKDQWDNRDLKQLRKQYQGKMPPCSCCGNLPPENASVSTGSYRVWNTEDGKNNHPGDMYWAPWMHEGSGCLYWSNCKDPRGHLIVVMPDGGYWDTDSRASNCTMKGDKTHRCWIKHGEAPNLTVDKKGHTCKAGAGSIQMVSWHGYLRNGELVTA